MMMRALAVPLLGLHLAAAPLARGIDHVNVAVADLEAAGARYRALGFALKPGRPHENGIRNLHAKFPDGTEIELITAPSGVDSLTRKYRAFLEDGEAPAFLALFTPGPGAEKTLAAGAVRVPGYVFFGARNASPTDRPEHFAHANTAHALTRVWLVADDLSVERRLLEALGARVRRAAVEFPDRVDAEIAEFDEGSVVLLPGRFRLVRGRPIVGLTVAVRDLDTAATFAGAGARRTATSVFVDPRDALGYRLELRAR
jgi:catechol 2,3-dioxygenase-like lactoylglutathione lyase family enzyme